MVVSNTGPLTSALQSDSLGLLAALFGTVHTTDACVAELIAQGWAKALAGHRSLIVSYPLADTEGAEAAAVAARVAAHPATKDRDPGHHLGEAEVMVLAQRPEFDGSLLLLDELAARAVATEIGLDISGFAGVLLFAVEEGLLTADDVGEKLARCRQQGTHYSKAFINQVCAAAREAEKHG
jgi:predicted nucleic acid-binding protein